MPVLRSNPELLVSFRKGERVALEHVYRAYVRQTERYLRALLHRSGSRDLASAHFLADLLQEVFIRAFSPSARSAYDGRRDYAPYLNTIARNCLIDTLRKHDPSIQALEDDDPTFEQPNWEPQSHHDPRVLATLNDYLHALPLELASVYEQRFVLGRSQAEASSTLGWTRAQLRTAEQRLTKGLRRSLVSAGLTVAPAARRSDRYVQTAAAFRVGKQPSTSALAKSCPPLLARNEPGTDRRSA